MSLTYACFEDVVGLSRRDCECFGTPPEGYSDSASGLYIDEVPGMNLKKVFAAAECSEDGWDILVRSREEGLRKMQGEVMRGVSVATKQARPVGKSVIGKEAGTATVMLRNGYHGIDVRFAAVRGGTAVISRIGAAFKFTGSVDVYVYGQGDDTPLYTRTISAVQNKHTWTTIEPIELDLGAYDATEARLWFLFVPIDGQEALAQKVASCSCSGKPKWNISSPSYTTAVVQDGQNWTAWAMAAGTYGDSLLSRVNWPHANETQGLSLDIAMTCNGRSIMCSGTPDYEGDPVQQSFAVGVQLFSALAVIAEVTGSTRVVREAIAGGDQLELLRASLMKDAEDTVGYVVERLSGDDVNMYSDCLSCNDANGPVVQTIRR